jgi:phytoene synthase
MAAPELSAVGQIAREGDEARFLAALLAPVDRREALFALIAFNVELSKIPVSVSEPILGEIRLTWWREALEDLFERDIARGHEVLAALAAAHRTRPLNREAAMALIEARLFALSDEAAGQAAIDDFLRDTGGAYHRLAVGILGGDSAAQEVAALAGWAEGAGRLIVATQAAVAGGEAAPFSPAPDAALQDGDGAAALKASLRKLAETGLSKLADARAKRADIPSQARPALMSVHQAERALVAATRPDFDLAVIDQPSPFRARAAFLLRAITGRF